MLDASAFPSVYRTVHLADDPYPRDAEMASFKTDLMTQFGYQTNQSQVDKGGFDDSASPTQDHPMPDVKDNRPPSEEVVQPEKASKKSKKRRSTVKVAGRNPLPAIGNVGSSRRDSCTVQDEERSGSEGISDCE